MHVEGKKEPVIVAFSSGAGSARTIEKLYPQSVEALDEEGSIIRVWEFKERDNFDPEPGYTKEEGDTEDERLLKTFAHLIADAHRMANKQLVEVVSIQSKSFEEERRQLSALRMLNDKLLSSLARRSRIRVATTPEEIDAEEAEDAADEKEDFLAELLQPLLKNVIGKAARKAGADVAQAVSPDEPPKANGAKE